MIPILLFILFPYRFQHLEIGIFLQSGATNRTTAIKWMLQAQNYEETLEDAHWICYNNGINPYIPAGKAIFDEVEAAIATL